jgi:thiamine-phosphate pyrophosphorylase
VGLTNVKLAESLASMTDKQSENSVFRILDAAINRAGEGIRVVEDYVRMTLGDAHLSSVLKQLRHDLTTAVETIDPAQRIAARDSVNDVGRTIKTESEYKRGEIEPSESGALPSGGMIQANLARAQQALRTIEEFSKTIDASISKNVEQLRYRTYSIEKAVLTTCVSLQNFADASLYVLTSGWETSQNNAERLSHFVKQMVEAKVSFIQLRDKSMSDRQLVECGKIISSLTRRTSTKFIMNDRADLAVAANADGVHLGQDDLSVGDARRIVGAARTIGVSTHSIEQARSAVLDGANYIGVGPVFKSTTKQFESHVGLDLVRSVAKEIQLPAFAIGGIDLNNVAQVVDAGLNRVAVSGSVVSDTDPKSAANKLREILRDKTNSLDH